MSPVKPISILLFLLLLISGCAIILPKITATGERTALENQIVGSYKMIEEDAWMVASLRAGNVPDTLQISTEKRRALEAVLRQRFNADDIDDFKLKGYIGEKIDGLLEIRPSASDADSASQALLNRVVSEENEDRALVMRRVVELHPEIDPSDRVKIGQVYARLKQEASPAGTWIQKETGEWAKK